MEMNEMIFEICRMVAIIIGAILAYYIVPALRTFVEKHVDDNLNGFINACVWAAQQTIEDNADKKQFVLDRVTEWLHQKEIAISPEQLDILIESAVLAMKREIR
jgi:LL-H family phage holin